MNQFDKVRATIKVRPEYQGRAAKPEVVALNGLEFEFLVSWLMDEGDPYPGEWALTPRGESTDVQALLHAGWIASGDVVVSQAKEQ